MHINSNKNRNVWKNDISPNVWVTHLTSLLLINKGTYMNFSKMTGAPWEKYWQTMILHSEYCYIWKINLDYTHYILLEVFQLMQMLQVFFFRHGSTVTALLKGHICWRLPQFSEQWQYNVIHASPKGSESTD